MCLYDWRIGIDWIGSMDWIVVFLFCCRHQALQPLSETLPQAALEWAFASEMIRTQTSTENHHMSQSWTFIDIHDKMIQNDRKWPSIRDKPPSLDGTNMMVAHVLNYLDNGSQWQRFPEECSCLPALCFDPAGNYSAIPNKGHAKQPHTLPVANGAHSSLPWNFEGWQFSTEQVSRIQHAWHRHDLSTVQCW